METNTSNPNDFQSAWNLSQYLVQQIGFLLTSASVNFRGGKQQQAFYDTEEISTLIYSFLTPDEQKELNLLGKKISISCNLYTKAQKGEEEINTDYRKYRSLHNRLVKHYRRKINLLLAKYNLGLSKKEDSSRMF